MENDSPKDRFSRRGFLGVGSAALATVAGSLAVSSAIAQENPAIKQTQRGNKHVQRRANWSRTTRPHRGYMLLEGFLNNRSGITAEQKAANLGRDLPPNPGPGFAFIPFRYRPSPGMSVGGVSQGCVSHPRLTAALRGPPLSPVRIGVPRRDSDSLAASMCISKDRRPR